MFRGVVSGTIRYFVFSVSGGDVVSINLNCSFALAVGYMAVTPCDLSIVICYKRLISYF